jgi:hypothetical protein
MHLNLTLKLLAPNSSVKVVGKNYSIKLNLSISQSMITKGTKGHKVVTKFSQRLDQYQPIPVQAI